MPDHLLCGPPAPPDNWPARLTALPLQALDIGPRLLNQLAAMGFHCVRDIINLEADELSHRASISLSAAGLVLSTVREIADGARDPTNSVARTLREELDEIVAHTRPRDGDRAISILERLYGLTGAPPMTLEAIGVELGVTRERVRQIRCKTEEEICEVLRWYHSQSLAAVRESVLEQGGLASLPSLASVVEKRLSPGRYDPKAYVKWIIEQAHDPTLTFTSGAEVVGPPLGVAGFHRIVDVIESLLTDHMLLTFEAAAECIAERLEEVQPAYSRHYAEIVLPKIGHRIRPGQFSAHPWSRADWAEYVLKLDGSPLHFSVIAARVQELTDMSFKDAGFNTVLNSDERFVRVGAGDFVLASSGVQPYGRFDEVIARYLRAADLPVHEDTIADDLLQSYTVTRSTVTAMLHINDQCFQHFGGGYWGLADLQYPSDPVLERQVLECLQSHEHGLSVGQIRQWLLDRTRGALCPSTTALELTLYLCPKVRRFGTSAPARFRIATGPGQASALERNLEAGSVSGTRSHDPLSRLKEIADLL
jgi:hypothetical protein